MTRLGAALFLGLVAVVSACGSKAGIPVAEAGGSGSTLPVASEASSPETSGEGASSSSSTTTAGEPDGNPSAPGAASGQSTTTTTITAAPPPDTGANNRLPLDVVVDPTCARRGTTVTVDVTTRPNAGLASMAVYHGNKPHSATGGLGEADRQGRWTWTFVVDPDAPYGQARVEIIGRDRTPGPGPYEASSNGDDAHRTIYFEVAKSC